MRACCGLNPIWSAVATLWIACCCCKSACLTFTSTTSRIFRCDLELLMCCCHFTAESNHSDWWANKYVTLYSTKWLTSAPGFDLSYSAVLTAKWIWCGAVPLLLDTIFPKALHQVWIGVLQWFPYSSPLLQPPQSTLRSADKVWSEELQSLLGLGGEYVYSKLLVCGKNRVQLIYTISCGKRKKIFTGLKSILKTSLIYILTLENPLHSLVMARRWRQHGNIMLSFSGDKGRRALLTGGSGIL